MSYNKDPFEGVPTKQINMSFFNRSKVHKTMLQPGFLVPVLLEPTYPNDEYTLNGEFMFRFQPMYKPIMEKITMRADWYYVPNRILWIESAHGGTASLGWKKFIALDYDDLDLGVPKMEADMEYVLTDFNNNVMNYFGLPLLPFRGPEYSTIIQQLNAFPLNAYLKIYDEYERIPQLEDERWFPLVDGLNTELFQNAFGMDPSDLKFRCLSSKWQKDYFTAALPTPQLGEAVLIPSTNEDFAANIVKTAGTDNPKINISGLGSDTEGRLTTNDATDVYIENQATMKQLRIAETLQGYFERIIKVGQRYRDFVKGFWRRDPEPNTVDVPVLLGSKFGRVQISDVMTQALTETATGISQPGDYTGQANLYSQDNGNIKYTCREHGWIMCILQLNAATSYGQGIERFWRYDEPTDYPLDMFASIGDQEILKEELLYNDKVAESSKNEETFGYIPRFSEARWANDMYTNALAFNEGMSWHLGRNWLGAYGTDYDQYTVISEQFVNAQTTEEDGNEKGHLRLIDVFRTLPGKDYSTIPYEGTVIAHIFLTVLVNRQLPMYSTPKLV